jgi:hypothetical protein
MDTKSRLEMAPCAVRYSIVMLPTREPAGQAVTLNAVQCLNVNGYMPVKSPLVKL